MARAGAIGLLVARDLTFDDLLASAIVLAATLLFIVVTYEPSSPPTFRDHMRRAYVRRGMIRVGRR